MISADWQPWPPVLQAGRPTEPTGSGSLPAGSPSQSGILKQQRKCTLLSEPQEMFELHAALHSLLLSKASNPQPNMAYQCISAWCAASCQLWGCWWWCASPASPLKQHAPSVTLWELSQTSRGGAAASKSDSSDWQGGWCARREAACWSAATKLSTSPWSVLRAKALSQGASEFTHKKLLHRYNPTGSALDGA